MTDSSRSNEVTLTKVLYSCGKNKTQVYLCIVLGVTFMVFCIRNIFYCGSCGIDIEKMLSRRSVNC